VGILQIPQNIQKWESTIFPVQIKNGLPCSSNKKHKVAVTDATTISFLNDFLSLIFIPRRLILKLNQIINISKK